MPSFTIRDLKKHLGPGLGLRKNRYLIEIPIPGIEGQTLNVLCRSAGLPERNISTNTVWHMGRRYTVRGETDYIGEYEISIVDDSDMQIRKMFDTWMKQVDNTKPKNLGVIGASFEEGAKGFLSNVKSLVKVGNEVKNLVKNPKQIINWFIGALNGENGTMPQYQTDINIWQLGPIDNKVYGYKLQNAFPKSIGIVTLEDDNPDTLSEFSVVFGFSEFEPLTGIKDSTATAILGDDIMEIKSGVEALFD